MQRSSKFLAVLALTALPFAALVIWALGAVFGAPAIGLKCSRLVAPARCEVLQSSFLGLIHTSPILIPEAEIAGAKTQRPVGGAGRRGGSYTLLLNLRSGRYGYYPALSGQTFAAVDADTRRLNDYLADPAATSIELRENLWASTLVPFIPVALVLGIFGIVTLVKRWRSTAVAGTPR
jgi:hypothetical protein